MKASWAKNGFSYFFLIKIITYEQIANEAYLYRGIYSLIYKQFNGQVGELNINRE